MAPMASASSPFFACYLLTPVLAPQRLRCTYVGFTVSPTRRIRQHNGEISNGAKRTTRHRPWEMVVVVHGFPSKHHALQFEYAWQHPYNCRFTKERLCRLVGKKGVGLPRSLKRKLIELHEILQLQPWSHFPLTISYTSEFAHSVARTSNFYAFPQHMRCETKVLEEFKGVDNRQSATQEDGKDDADATIEIDSTERCCFVCEEDLDTDSVATGSSKLSHHLQCYHEGCGMQCHTLCLADHFLSTLSDSEEEPRGDDIAGSLSGHQQQHTLLRPEIGTCPDCQGELLWPLLVQQAAARQRGRVADSTATSSSSNRKKKERRMRDGSAVKNGVEPALCTTELGGDMTRQPSAGTGNGEKPSNDSCNERYLSTLSEAASLSTNSYTPYSDENWFENDGDDHFRDYEDEENGLDTLMAGVDDCHHHAPSIRSPEAREFVGEAKRNDRASAAVIDLTLDDE